MFIISNISIVVFQKSLQLFQPKPFNILIVFEQLLFFVCVAKMFRVN